MVRAAMADEPQPEGDADEAAPLPCSPCRGTGKLLSGAGGTQHEVPCPWCEGGGVTLSEHDAQAARRGDQGAASPS